MSKQQPTEPHGLLVSTTPALLPSPIILRSHLPPTSIQSVTLVPTTEAHALALCHTIGGPQHAYLHRYIALDPPGDDLAGFTLWLKNLIEMELIAYAVFKRSSDASEDEGHQGIGTAVGVICLVEALPIHRRIEIGLCLGPLIQRTTAATEAIYLLMKYAFDDLGYRRLEWKANALHERSLKAARRLGFVFEEIFRNHMILRGRSRDTAWFSVTEEEWRGGVRAGLEGWLDSSNFEDGKQKRRFEDVREEAKEKQKEKEWW